MFADFYCRDSKGGKIKIILNLNDIERIYVFFDDLEMKVVLANRETILTYKYFEEDQWQIDIFLRKVLESKEDKNG